MKVVNVTTDASGAERAPAQRHETDRATRLPKPGKPVRLAGRLHPYP